MDNNGNDTSNSAQQGQGAGSQGNATQGGLLRGHPPDFAHTVTSIFNTMNSLLRPARPQPTPDVNQSEDFSDMPPLEAVTAHASNPAPVIERTTTVEVSNNATALAPAPAAQRSGNVDIEMPALEPLQRGRAEADSDSDMPALLDISDSEDSDSFDEGDDAWTDDTDDGMEVEQMMDVLLEASVQPEQSGNSTNPNPRHRVTVEDDPEEMPLLEPVPHRGRRPRVEEEHVEERRATPFSQSSTTNPEPPTDGPSNVDGADRPMRPLPRNGPPPLRTPVINPLFGPGGIQNLSDDANLYFRQMFRRMATGNVTQQDAPTTVQPQPNQHVPTPPPQANTNAANTDASNTTNNGRAPPENADAELDFNAFFSALTGLAGGEQGQQGNEQDGDDEGGVFVQFLRAMMGNGMQSMSDFEKEDPERAKKLISGLEVVPLGLVKRLERVSAQSEEGATGGEAGCAVCWESLLNSESNAPVVTDDNVDAVKNDLQSASATTAEAVPVPEAVPVTPHTDNQSSGEDQAKPTSSSPSEEKKEEGPKIVALPCSHVFHENCLTPWFSRPRQTTCPTCRFNIDPENLTYTFRPIPRPPRQRRPTQPGQAANNGATGAHTQGAPDTTPTSSAPAGPAPAEAESAQGPVPIPQGRPEEQPQAGNASGRPRRPRPAAAFFSFGVPMDGPGGPGMMNFGAFGGFETAETHGPFPFAPPGGGMEDVEVTDMGSATFTFTMPAAGEARVRMETRGPPPAHMHGNPHPNMNRNTNPFRPMRPPPRQRKEWTVPAAPGLTIRQRVEKMEREAGLRCSDISCGIGPTDEDPCPEVSSPEALKQIAILADCGDSNSARCEHRFHPACLVSAERVAGWGSDPTAEEVEVACPVCRKTGHIHKHEWELGVRLSSE